MITVVVVVVIAVGTAMMYMVTMMVAAMAAIVSTEVLSCYVYSINEPYAHLYQMTSVRSLRSIVLCPSSPRLRRHVRRA